jgi:hypothetical protein
MSQAERNHNIQMAKAQRTKKPSNGKPPAKKVARRAMESSGESDSFYDEDEDEGAEEEEDDDDVSEETVSMDGSRCDLVDTPISKAPAKRKMLGKRARNGGESDSIALHSNAQREVAMRSRRSMVTTLRLLWSVLKSAAVCADCANSAAFLADVMSVISRKRCDLAKGRNQHTNEQRTIDDSFTNTEHAHASRDERMRRTQTMMVTLH